MLLTMEPWSSQDLNRIPAELKLLCGACTLNQIHLNVIKLLWNLLVYRDPGNPGKIYMLAVLVWRRNSGRFCFILFGTGIYKKSHNQWHFAWTCHEVDSLLNKPYFSDLTDDEKLQIILDCTVLVDQQNRKLQSEQLGSLEFHSRRLLHSLLGVRFRMLKTVLKRQH